MRKEPYISVVMPAYNAENYIERAIGSVLQQTYMDFELLVVDDCSEDQTVSVVQKMAEHDERIILYKMERNLGASTSRNFGVSHARGEWIAFLDSDDIWREDKLEKQVALLNRHPDGVLSYTASAFMDEAGNRYSYVLEAEEKTTYKTLLRKNLLSCSSVMVRRDVMRRYPMGGDWMHEDYASWLQILREIPCAYGLNEPLLVYRLSANSKSGSRVRSAKMLYNAYRYVGIHAVFSLWLVFRYMFYSLRKRRHIVG